MVRATCLIALSALLIVVPGASAARPLREALRDKPGGFLTRPSDERPADVALDYVRSHPRTFELDAGDISGLRLTRAYRAGAGTVHLQWEQVYRGIPVFGPGLRANVAADGRLIDISVGALPDPGVSSIHPRLPAPARDASLTLFRGNRLAWRFLRRVDPAHAYDTVVDATTGETLYRVNRVREANAAQVYQTYPGAPLGGTRIPVDLTPWISSSTTLSGPYAHVYADPGDVIDSPGGTPGGSNEIAPVAGDWNFAIAPVVGAPHCPLAGCTWNSTAPNSWMTNRDAQGTQLFFYINRYHDHLRDAPGIGFGPSSGNFEGADAVQGQVDDGAGTNGAGLPDCGSPTTPNYTNNAYALPLPDGQPLLLQFFLWSSLCTGGGDYDVNPADDAFVVDHEYTHGMNNRLVTYGDGTPALNAKQSWAMDEGLADWYSLDFLAARGLVADSAAPGELATGAYENTELRFQPFDCPVGASPSACPGSSTSGSGGFTFGDFAKIWPLGWEPHADGEIISETLWDLRTRMIAAHPADGVTRTRALITGALRNVVADPSYLDLRNLILTENTLRGYGDAALIWSVFAARGMGYLASVNPTLGGDDDAPHQDFSLPPVPPPPPPPPVNDKTRPKLTRASMLRKRVKIGVRSAFKFTLSEVATVEIALARGEGGRRSKGRCRPASRKLRKRPRCTRYVAAGSLVKINMSAGAHSVGFTGKLRGRALKPGSYRGVIRATDPSGNRSTAATLSFKLTRH